MPPIFKIGAYWVYFCVKENEPLESIHVYVAQESPSDKAAKIWITRAGKCYLCQNHSQIPSHTLRNIIAIIEARSEKVIQKWVDSFGEIHYFC